MVVGQHFVPDPWHNSVKWAAIAVSCREWAGRSPHMKAKLDMKIEHNSG
jgi:hypothetical protein